MLGLIKDYAVRWRPQFLLTSMSYFDVLNIGVEMTAPSCGAKSVRRARAGCGHVCSSHFLLQMNFYSAYVTTMLLPLGAMALCGTMWCVHAEGSAAAFSLTVRPRRRLAYYIVFDKLLSRERIVPLVLAGRVIVPAGPALTDAQKATTLHAFRVRCVPCLMSGGVAHADTRAKVLEEQLLAPDAALSWCLQKGAMRFVPFARMPSFCTLTTCGALQVMELYGTRSLEAGTFLRADYGVRLPAADTLRSGDSQRSPRNTPDPNA